MQPKIQKAFLFTTILATGLGLSACGEESIKDDSEVLAKYDGGTVTLDEANAKTMELFGQQGIRLTYDKLPAEMRENILKEVAVHEIIAKKALEEDADKDPEVQTALARLRANLAKQKFLMQMAEEKATDQAAEEKYAELKSELSGKEEVHLRHILVGDEATAKKVKQKLDQGKDFAAIAKQYSTDTANKDNGGELGYVLPGQLVPEFEEAAFALKEGQISGPVKSDFGWHIIKREDSRKAEPADFAKVKDRIKQGIAAETVTEYMQNIAKDINLDVIESAAANQAPEPKKPEINIQAAQ